MGTRPSSTRQIGWALLKCTLLVPILFTFGCANGLNLIPEGTYDVFDHKLVRPKLAAKVDYPIVVSVPGGTKQFPIFWTKKGEVIWTKPFWTTVTWWRFGLIAEGVENALCGTDWKPVGNEDVDVTKVPCDIDVDKFLAIPLVGMLDYRFGGDKTKPPADNEATDGLARLYYLIEKK